MEQDRTTQQIEQTISAQAIEAQKTIEGATKVAVQTQREVKGLSNMARKAEYTATLTASKVEQQAEEITQQLHAQKEKAIQDAQATKAVQEQMARQLEEA